QIFVNNPAFSLPVFNAPDPTICANTPTAVGVAPVAGYSYQWTGTGLSNNFISNPLANISFERTYPVRVADANGCEITDTVIVHVQNVLANAGPDWQVCSNAIITLGTPAQPNTQYLWEPPASAWQNGTDAFSAQPQVLVATNLDFRLTATTSAGCVSTDSVRVTINDFPLVADAQDTTICFNQPVLIGAPALPGVQYQWSPATGLSNPNVAQPLANPSSDQMYTLVATFPGVCAATASDQVFVTVSDPRFNSPDISYCPEAGPFQLGNGVPTNAQSYSWQPAALVTNATIANPETLNPPPNQLTAFSISIVNSAGCVYRDTVRILPVTPAPSAGPDRIICKGQTASIGSTSNPTGNNISYSWSPVTNLSDPGNPNPVFTGNSGGIFIYVLTKFDGNLNCRITDTVIIQVVDSLIPALTAPILCRNACAVIGTSPQPGIQYSWSPASGLSNSTIANPVVCVGSASQLYTLTAQNAIGCSSTVSILVSVSSNEAPQVSIPDVTACVGQNSVSFQPSVTPAGAYDYLWSPDNGTLSNVLIPNPEILVGNPGIRTYQLQVTDNGNGCTNLSSATVTVQNCSPLVTIGDYVWYDANRNGLQDSDEVGVNGVLVTLFNAADFVLGTTVTNANGLYLFNNIPPGTGYYVRFTRPTGYVFTLPLIGGLTATNNSKADTSGKSASFDAIAGTSILNIDAGLIPEGCVVPVSLLSFTGQLQGDRVLLQWQTTAEFNSDYFDVERKGDRTVFSKIGRVRGQGTSSVMHAYSLVDPEPIHGMNYYRLKQVDYDGRSNYSSIVAVAVNRQQSMLILVDEAHQVVQIQLPQVQDRMQIQLYNAAGQLI
ncbi:MAG TPA: SdrD B-like domain-containing protein, partial [Ferruginibacter sp.]|nr:SdrD B-like domain-containing protein [Ferruginibacter sp.]